MAALIRLSLRQSRNTGQYFSRNYLLKEGKQINRIAPYVLSERSLSALPKKKKDLYVEITSKLDNNAGISTQLFQEFKSVIEEEGVITEQDVSLLLYICSNGPFDSSPSTRIKFADDIWAQLENHKLQPTSRLFNSRLKVLCSNKKSFTPVEELASMKALGIEPTKMTYIYMIEGFCRNGDIAGAEHVLEAMKKADIEIGISVFNSFITGHLRNGSHEEASNVLKTLRFKGLDPNANTFFRFIEHYAQEGDVESIIKYLAEAEKEDVFIGQDNLLQAYKLMLQSGKEEQAKQIIPMMSEKLSLNMLTMQSLCQLIAEGFHKEALSLYLEIPKDLSVNAPVTAGSFLLKAMVINDQDVKDVLMVADKLLEAHPNSIPHRIALLFAFKVKKYDLSMDILERFFSQKQNVRIPMILPALCHFRDTNNLEGVYKTVDMILNTKFCEETVDSLREFAYPALKMLNQSNEDILTKYKGFESKWNTIFFLRDLQAEGYKTALENAKGKVFDTEFLSCLEFKRQLMMRDLPEQKENMVNLLVILLQYNFSNSFIASILNSRLNANDFETFEYILHVLSKEKISVPYSFISMQKISQAPQDIQDKINAHRKFQAERRFETSYLSMAEMRQKTTIELEEYIKIYPEYRLAKAALLNKYLGEKNLERSLELLQALEKSNFEFQKIHLEEIVWKLAEIGDKKTAHLYYEKFQKLYGESESSDLIPLSIAARNAQQGNIEGALELVELAKSSKPPKSNERESIVRSKMITQIFETLTIEEAEKFHQSLMGGRYLPVSESRLTNRLFIKKALDSDDDDTLLARIRSLYKNYKAFPCIDPVMRRFIVKKDVDRLKEVLDLSVIICGKKVSHHKLAVNFIECNMPSKAASIFENLGDKLSFGLLQQSCQYFIDSKQINHLETLVETVKGLPVSRNSMLEQLIKAHVSVKDVKKAVEVLETYDAEFLVPDKSILNLLVEELRISKMEQPDILKAFLPKNEMADKALESSDSSPTSSDSDSDTKMKAMTDSSPSSSDSDSDSNSDIEKKTMTDPSLTTSTDSVKNPIITENVEPSGNASSESISSKDGDKL